LENVLLLWYYFLPILQNRKLCFPFNSFWECLRL
jgi:hypothetical protein